jgi:dienelactone hydrolase
MAVDRLRQEISAFLQFSIPHGPAPFETHSMVKEHDYDRLRITYDNEEHDAIPAFLLIPHGTGPFPAVLVHHQHNSQWHVGKSEVCGLAGDPLQAFGPALAHHGIIVLAPDSICFEDRRVQRSGIEPDPSADADWLQHYNALCYRLLRGDTLMRRVLEDAARGVSVLCAHRAIDSQRIGTLGHSYGGNTVLFHAALDVRLGFACASGAACTYADKMRHGTGIEMAEVIPGFTPRFDVQDLVKCIAPRKALLVSATEDKYSYDAEVITQAARETFAALGAAHNLVHNQYSGGHALTQERFEDIIEWIVAVCRA